MLSGREKEVEDIVGNCQAGRLVVLTHEPGFGATALLTEGVLNRMRSLGFVAVRISEWQGSSAHINLKDKLASAVREQADPGFFPQPDFLLLEMLQGIRARTGRHVALLLDQFEDYLRCQSDTQASDEFDAELSNAIAWREGHFVIAMQQHALPAFKRFAPFVPNLLGFQMTLGPLEADAAREVIRGEEKFHGVEFEASAVDSLVTAAAAGRGVNPYLLTAGLNRLLNAAKERKWKVVKESTIRIYGGPNRLIFESLDGVITRLRSHQLELFFQWCGVLISPEGRRVALSERALKDYCEAGEGLVSHLLSRSIELGLLRTVDLADGRRYEIARESMTGFIRDWWKRYEIALISRRKLRLRILKGAIAAGCLILVYAVWWAATGFK